MFGAPLAAGLLAMDGVLGLDGWQWLFLAEGLPTVAFGIWLRCSLAEAPATAKFLHPAERQWLSRRNEEHKVGSSLQAEHESLPTIVLMSWQSPAPCLRNLEVSLPCCCVQERPMLWLLYGLMAG